MQITKGERQEITYLLAPFSERRRHSGAKRGDGIFFPADRQHTKENLKLASVPCRGLSVASVTSVVALFAIAALPRQVLCGLRGE